MEIVKRSILPYLFVFALVSSLCSEQVYTGSVIPSQEIELSFPIDGILSKVMVKEGEQIKKGDVLLILDDQLQVLESKRRRLVWKDRTKLDTQLKTDKFLETGLKATRALYSKSGSVSRDELLQQEIRYNASQGTIEAFKEAEKREELEYQIAEFILRQHTLESPIEASVTEIRPDAGEWIRAGNTVIGLVNAFECKVEFNIPIQDVPIFRMDPVLEVTTNDPKEKVSKKAKVIFISPIADRASGLVLIKARFQNEDLAIIPGSTVQVRVLDS